MKRGEQEGLDSIILNGTANSTLSNFAGVLSLEKHANSHGVSAQVGRCGSLLQPNTS